VRLPQPCTPSVTQRIEHTGFDAASTLLVESFPRRKIMRQLDGRHHEAINLITKTELSPN
jgi:hypothetical protein